MRNRLAMVLALGIATGTSWAEPEPRIRGQKAVLNNDSFFALGFASGLKAPSDAETAGLIRIDTRSFAIPVHVAEYHRANVESLRLMVSVDSGTTWKAGGQVKPDAEFFVFTAPVDGVYWFAVQLILKNGIKSPSTLGRAEVGQKVLVETARDRVQNRSVKEPTEIASRIDRLREEMQKVQAQLDKIRLQLAELETTLGK
jgi:hypothetical protein